MKNSKIYFASDFHFGIPNHESSLIREKKFVRWLDMIKKDATHIFLLGDIFDFWFEYDTAVPKGYVRLLGKIAEITDSGIPVHIFRGNHDIWAFDYFKKELNCELYRKPVIKEFDGKKFFLAHGDGLGPGDTGYKMMKKIFEYKPNQFLFKWLHPDIGSRMGLYFSKKSRLASINKYMKKPEKIKIQDERLMHYAKRKITQFPEVDYFVFGHRHIPLQEKIGDKSELIILGDWLFLFSYAVFENGNMSLKYFESDNTKLPDFY